LNTLFLFAYASKNQAEFYVAASYSFATNDRRTTGCSGEIMYMHPIVTSDLARQHRADLHREAGAARLVRLATNNRSWANTCVARPLRSCLLRIAQHIGRGRMWHPANQVPLIFRST
jgi:hypothetical protein